MEELESKHTAREEGGVHMSKRLTKKLVVGVLLVVTLMSTVAMAQAREVGPKRFGFEFYQSDGSARKYADTYNRGLLGEYGSVQGTSVGGDVGSIVLTIYHCNLQTLAPDAAMTSSGRAKMGYTNLYYTAQWINSTCFTRLEGKGSYIEAMISGYWNP